MYFFISSDIESAAKIFMELYEEDIMDYAAERVDIDVDGDDYEVDGCSICITVNKETDEVESVTITASITMEEEVIELEPADIELEEELIQMLLEKTKTE